MKDDDIQVPTFYSPTVKKVMMEYMHDYGFKTLVDRTPGDGSSAIAALEMGVKYVGVCFNETHTEKLY